MDELITSSLTRLSRQVSVERVMRTLATFGHISRASLAKELGLSKQTISEVMHQLTIKKWVRVIGQTTGHVGRRALTYEINPDCAGVIVVDLGGKKICGCIANLVGDIVQKKQIATSKEGGMAVIDQVGELVDELLQTSAIANERVSVAVIGVPGVFDEVTGQVHMAPNIKAFGNFDVRRALEQRITYKVIIENDVNLAAKGECWLSSDQDECVNLVFISIGTGIGAGIIVNGELVRGASSMAGEIGYMLVGGDQSNMLESIVSGVALQQDFSSRTGVMKTAKEIFAMASDGNQLALDSIDRLAEALAGAIANINLLLNPDRFVLGGSIGNANVLHQRLRHYFAKQPWSAPFVVAASAGNYATLAGGLALGLEHTQRDLFAISYGKGVLIGKPATFTHLPLEQFIGSMEGVS